MLKQILIILATPVLLCGCTKVIIPLERVIPMMLIDARQNPELLPPHQSQNSEPAYQPEILHQLPDYIHYQSNQASTESFPTITELS